LEAQVAKELEAELTMLILIVDLRMIFDMHCRLLVQRLQYRTSLVKHRWVFKVKRMETQSLQFKDIVSILKVNCPRMLWI
jgi:hypothetical protein